MTTLLPCPVCAGQPKLSSLVPERQSMKYFCGVHASCGNWKENEELAAEDWNRRVREYKEFSLRRRGIKLVECPNCGGKGEYGYQPERGSIYPVKCDVCSGTGQITEMCLYPEYLEEQGRISSRVYCEDCDYETDKMAMKDLVFKLSMEGGYVISDKSGGYSSQCPKCGSRNLSLESN